MGTALTLLPAMGRSSDEINISHTVLPLCADSDLISIISLIAMSKSHALYSVHSLTCHLATSATGHCYGSIEVDGYGDRMTYLTSSDLVSLFEQYGLDKVGAETLCAYAWLKAADDTLPIWLYWN